MEGEGLDITPASYFIGTLKPDASATVSFNVTPHGSGNLSITATYQNSVNIHMRSVYLPITLDDNLKQASLVASNLVVTRDGDTYHLTGDVSNAGLELANAVTVTAGGEAVPVDPYRTYVIGSLNPDDFASFEISFRAPNSSSVALLLQFKDRDGRVYTDRTGVPLSEAAGPAQGIPSFPLGPVLIGVLALAVALIIIYSWRKRQ
jgi:hypothetical protein